LATGLAHRIDALARQVDRLAPYDRVRIRECADLEAGIGIVTHGIAIERDTGAGQPLDDFGLGMAVQMIGVIQIYD
jgi:hypothetical protein